jgi:MerR family transcriptional regulator, light-induced transcriptional regulator
MSKMIPEAVYQHYLNALLDGDKKQCAQIALNLIDQKISIKEIYMELFQRSMYRIGQLWEREKCSVAGEHVATKITEGLIELVSTNSLDDDNNGKLALITCVDKEYHELGARMVAGFLEAYGWRTIFIGSNTPQSDILNFVREKKPDLVGISNNFYINVIRLLKLIQAIKEEFPEQEIIVGGQALADGRSEELSQFQNVYYITCLNGLEKYLAERHPV